MYMPERTRIEKVNGVMIGKVKSIKDEESGSKVHVDAQGRVFIIFPLLDQEEGYWAPVATAMAGNARGTWLMPEEDDEVVVAFEDGDINHPFIIGFLWNGQAKPPETDPNKRLIKSKQGHSILLDDTKDQEKIVLTSSKGMTVTMDDTKDKEEIEIKTSKGIVITLDDPGKVMTIKATQAVTVEGPESVTVKASKSVTVDSAQTVTIKGGSSVSIEGTTQVTVKAPKIVLGEGASQPAVLGTALMTYLDELVALVKSHIHPGTAGAPPIGPLPVVTQPSPVLAPLEPPPPAILSEVITEA
jgi:uncharacterized protein involved in type VI secretion and phage assembly